MIGICGATGGYRVAVAELPMSVSPATASQDAVVIVKGSHGWAERAISALREGAVGIVVADPGEEDDKVVAELAAVAGRAPVVLDRPRMRADVVADAGVTAAARYLAADAAADVASFRAVVRDAVGWLRVVAGGPLTLRSRAVSAHGVLALLDEAATGRAAVVTVSLLAGRGGSRLRVQAAGETRTEVELDDAADVAVVEVSTIEGALRLPRRRESHERLALRGAISALTGGRPVDDLEAFRHDAALALRLLSSSDN
ncbi:hypothetical protein ACTJKH_00080 [Microbacterium sp. 22215]|uniref:hypothetical protein n=1 Tax=Microbacterium sp. 22215 TaxID=3453893 RepID=UPI003F858E51